MQLTEVERKRRLGDNGVGLRSRLAELGYEGGGSFSETDTYYSRPDVDFMATVECLRVRRRHAFAEVTYKPASTAGTSRDGVTAKVETNVLLSGDGQAIAANRLLAAIGMRELATVEKHRTMWRHPTAGNVVVALDAIAGVGAFAEVEVMAEDSAAATAILERVERDLGLVGCPVERLPYRDLVMQQAAAL